ncbi:MAG: anthranilate synthase component I family protein, partial [Spirochaetaceae bacterium]|nr:anthranilate synthase component I family protein [Spirochaetaceae bacterium]
MINTTVNSVPTPSIDRIFRAVDSYSGISLFSSQTDDDREYTGINPLIILTEKEIRRGAAIVEISDPLGELDNLVSELAYLPDEVSVLGYISYDFKDRLEEKGLYSKREQGIYPDLYFAVYEHYIISSRSEKTAQIYTLSCPFPYDSVTTDSLDLSRLNLKTCGTSTYTSTSLDKKAYSDGVRKTVDHIKQGDIYQANITRAIRGETTYTPVETAMKLYHSNRIAYGVFASIPGGHVVSTSPELFFRTEKRKITSSPIKGTIARGLTEEEDTRNREELLHSEKNIAELAMIVDLLRNDLSLVSIPGTVDVPRFPLLMTLDNVYHLYAHVTGELLPGTGAGAILKKTFPGGSITGCPKIRSCQIIDELESTPRGIYTGSFGKISFNGDSTFNIMIRSLFQQGNSIIFNAGGGITLLSDPEEEYEETIHKGTNIWKAINMEN